jgi:hypothetical protein
LQLGDTVPFDVLFWTEEAGLKSGGVGKTARPDVSCCLVTTSGQLIKRKQHLPQRESRRETNTFALQRHSTEHSKQIFPEKELRTASVPISTFMPL